MDQAAWLEHGWRELGEAERTGGADNPRILRMFRDAGHPEIAHDETAWCAAFVGACLERAGVGSTRSLLARSYLAWGERADSERLGVIAVLRRGDDPNAGHVGFLLGATADAIVLLGGNQGDRVGVARFARADLIDLRWPAAVAASAVDPWFEAALRHVLEMEGGFDDDPQDPGGPTNKGLTLDDLAEARGLTLDAASREMLLDALKSISDSEVRDIYRARYWLASSAGDLPRPLGFMHFDTAVNQGVGTALRMLQAAVGAPIDGEFGPETAAAAAAASPEALDHYADLRRQRYRALAGFARFGRGWLRRVDTTLARARGLEAAAANDPAEPRKGKTPMPNTMDHANAPATASPAEPKWWGQSMTIWGTLITAAATVAPMLGPMLGLDVSAETIRQLGGQASETARGLVGLAGTLMAIFGRARASAPLMRRDVSLRL